MCYINAAYWSDFYMGDEFTAPRYSEAQIAAIRNQVTEFISFSVTVEHSLYMIPHLIATLYLSANQFVPVLAVASYVPSLLLSPFLTIHYMVFGVISVAGLSIFAYVISFWFKRVLALHYLATEYLERELEMNFEASQKADSILNHSLKNRMADAAGEIELFLSTYKGPGEEALVKCITTLRGGMDACMLHACMLHACSMQRQQHAAAAGRCASSGRST